MKRRQPLPLTWTCNSLFHLKVFHIKCLTTAAPAVHWITKIYTCTVDVRSIWHQLFCIVIHQALDRASHLSKGSSVDRFPGYWSACQSILKQDVRVCNCYKILGIENTAYMNLRDWVNEPCKEKRFECSEKKSLYFVWQHFVRATWLAGWTDA